MTEQPRMFGIQQRFEEFHRENPHIYALVVKYCRQVMDAGLKKYSVNAIFERIRWHLRVEVKSRDEFKLNNNYRSRYARLVMDQEPGLEGFFETRELKELS